MYCFSSSAGLTGTLTLNAQGVAGARFIFQIGSTLTTASSSSVRLINGAQPCNVFWQIGSSATLGTATSFVGNIMALASITMTTGATLRGRALARSGAVYGIFDNTGSDATILFRMKWTTASGVHVVTRWVPGGSIFRTWEHWAKPGTKVVVSYKNPATGKWVKLASVVAVHGRFPPCVYQRGFETP